MSLPTDKFANVILDSIADGVFTVDRDWKVSSFNKSAERITGISRSEAIGKPCCEVFRANICEADCALRRTMRTGRPVVNLAIYIVNADGERIPVSISTALLRDRAGEVIGGAETFRDLSVVEELRKELAGRRGFADIIGKSRAMCRVFDVLPEIAESDSTVLIHGESGTGKELVARAIHDLSPRSDRLLVTVNCGALPDALLASELFGYVAGAFTDARKDKPGRFARAEGGTIFLDEIGDVSPALQVQLLRVLQEREYEPLGGTGPVKADVRVIAATNRELAELVREGTFREDLYYRIHVVAIQLPPLRERREDIPLLVDHFVSKFNRMRGRDVAGVSDAVMEVLMRHEFRGNVRELENIIEYAFVLCRGSLILPEHLPVETGRPRVPAAGVADRSGASGSGTRQGGGQAGTLGESEERHILEMLERHGGNRTATARALGIHKTTLWRKLKKMGIPPRRPGRQA